MSIRLEIVSMFAIKNRIPSTRVGHQPKFNVTIRQLPLEHYTFFVNGLLMFWARALLMLMAKLLLVRTLKISERKL